MSILEQAILYLKVFKFRGKEDRVSKINCAKTDENESCLPRFHKKQKKVLS